MKFLKRTTPDVSLVSFSPWLFAAACAMLTVIIAVFALNNYHQEKQLMLESLSLQGRTILRFIKTNARGAIHKGADDVRMAVWQWSDHVQQVLDTVADQPGIKLAQLIDEEGHILAGSGELNQGDQITGDTMEFLEKLQQYGEERTLYRINESIVGTKRSFQVATAYHPFGGWGFPPRIVRRNMPAGPAFTPRGMLMPEAEKNALQQYLAIQSKTYYLLIGLDTEELQAAMRRQSLQILFLSVVLLLVGLGGWLSLLTLQGLRGSQSRLRSVQQFNDLLISSLPVGLLAFGQDKRIHLYNHSAEEMIGKSSAEVVGKDPSQVLPEPFNRELALFERENPARITPKEITFTESDGSEKSLVLIILQVLDSERKSAGLTLLIQDISQIKDLQKEVRRHERLAALGKMAAGVAHELRNPLSSIKGLTILLKGKVQHDNVGSETADILINEVERLNRSIGELLEYARPDKLHLEELAINEILGHSVRLLEADIQSAGISLYTEYGELPAIMGDSDKLQQVFLNIILNSIQAMEAGGKLEISTYREEGYCVCQFVDTGCGLAEESVARVFDPYFTTKSSGTGLGLAMSAKIIEAHKGKIELSSRENAGTTVRVFLQWC